MSAQPDLFEHGIYTEDSDIRAHVSPLDKVVYVFKTREGIRAIEKNNPPLVNGFQNGVVGRTAAGWLVKPEWIDDVRILKFFSWTGWSVYDPEWPTTEKGQFAVNCIVYLMKLGRFPIWVGDACEAERGEVQIAGTDILMFCKKKIQVKCDEPSAKTANLFLQKAERNPKKRY